MVKKFLIMNLSNRLLVFPFIIIFLVSCSNSPITTTNNYEIANKQTKEININNNNFDPPFKENEGFRFHYIFNQKDKTSLIHRIEEGETYKASIEITNNFSFENSFRLFIFVDDKLTKVLNNDKNVNFIDFTSLQPSKSKTEYFSLDNLHEGKHELVALLVRKPEKHLLKEEYINFVNFTKEFTIIKGKESIDTFTKKTRTIEIEDTNYSGPELTYLTKQNAIKDPKNTITLINSDQNVFKSTLNFWNELPDTVYSIIAMDNNEQINLENNEYNVKNTGAASLNLNLPLISSIKKHNIIILLIKKTNNQNNNVEIAMSTNKITIIYKDKKTEFD